MKRWKDYVNEVKEKGFDNASPLARLIWSCEVGRIDQHASADLNLIADAIEAAREYRSVTSYQPAANGSCSQCDALSDDPTEHSEWCGYRKAVTALDAALAKLGG
jgi:hypothetical protein